MKTGDKVIFTGELKNLDKGTVGILSSIYDTWGVIVYPQYASYEDDGKGGFKLIKGVPNRVYAHSANINLISLYTIGL